MSSREVELCHLLIEEFFGSIVANVVTYLCNNGYQSLRFIAINTKLKNDQVQYKANVENILKLLYYPKIIYTSKVLYGDVAELIVEEMLHHGHALMTLTMERVMNRLKTFDTSDNLKEKTENVFKDLVKTRFLQREPELENLDENQSDIAPSFKIDEKDAYEIPDLNELSRKRSSNDDHEKEPPSKRQKTNESQARDATVPIDDGLYWSVNFTRFEQFFRDQAIVAAMRKKHGMECGEIIRALLRISEVTTAAYASKTEAISAAEISRSLASGYSIPIENISQQLKLMSSSPEKIVMLEDSSGGGCYAINLRNAAHVLASAHIVSYVEERFGSKACRIFRLLILKQHLEQKQVEEFAMIPSKEAKEYLYNMLSENFLTMQEIPRSADHAPSRTFYLYAVNLPKISRLLLVKSFKTVSNLLVRQNHTKLSYKRLLDKRRQIDAMKESLKETDDEQLQDIEDMLSSTERAQLTKYEHCANKLRNGQSQIVDTILMLKLYLRTVFSTV